MTSEPSQADVGAYFPTEECRSCHKPVYWAEKVPFEINPKNHQPKTIPVDADSIGVSDGKVITWAETVKFGDREVRILKFRYVSRTSEPLRGNERYAVSHFATCPDREKWRRK